MRGGTPAPRHAWPIGPEERGVHNRYGNLAYVAVTEAPLPPEVRPGWEVEPAALDTDFDTAGARLIRDLAAAMPETEIVHQYSPESFTGTELDFAVAICEAVLDVWYDFVGSHPHLVYYFSNEQGKPDPDYLAAVRKRFGQWIKDTCAANYDQDVAKQAQQLGLPGW